MRKLGSIENPEDFILAIANGANVNGTWRGSPLVEHYFTECMRLISMQSHEFEKPMQKFKALVIANADLMPLFYTSYKNYEYGNLVRLITNYLELLETLLSSEQTEKLFLVGTEYSKDLKKLHEKEQSVSRLMEVLLRAL